ncbi:MAG: hypothetical protein NT031_11535 [Planctomycetota bacterium]|nr:hypothetical protein [Planctomycetota bacterium]
MMENDRPPAAPVTLGVCLSAPGDKPPVRPGPPLSEADFLAVRQASIEYSVVCRTVARARRSAAITLTIGVLAVLTTLLSFDWVSLVTSLGVCAVGVVESIAAGRLKRGQPQAIRLLCLNQLCFLGLIVAYCVIQIATFSTAKTRDALLSPEFRSALGGMPDMQKSIMDPIERLAPLVIYALYGGTIVLSALIQGNLARSYRACGRRMASFHAHTPAWVSRLLRETHAG